jgi:hypothetical protein
MIGARLFLDSNITALFAAHFPHFGLLFFWVDQDCGFMPKIPGEFLNGLGSQSAKISTYTPSSYPNPALIEIPGMYYCKFSIRNLLSNDCLAIKIN